MSSSVSRNDSSSSSPDVSSDFKDGGLDFDGFVQKLMDSSSETSQAVQGIDYRNPILKGIDSADGFDATEANTIATRMEDEQSLDNNPLKLSQAEFLKAFGMGCEDCTGEAGQAPKNDNKAEEPGALEEAGTPPAGGAEAGGGKEAGGQASKDWNGDGKIDAADKEIEDKLQEVADKTGKSIEEVAQEIGGENGKIDEQGEIDKLDKMAKSAEADGSGESDDGSQAGSNGLNDLIQGFGGSNGADGANSLFSQAA